MRGSRQKVAVLNSLTGNIGSVCTILKFLDVEPIIFHDPVSLRNVDKLICPGVGHYAAGMRSIRDRGLLEPIKNAVLDARMPILGICLGMQMLFDSSEEDGFETSGFGFVSGRCRRISNTEAKVPHIGWNNLSLKKTSVLLNGISNPRFYFLHSYCAEPTHEKVVAATVNHGSEICALVEADNVMGAQFHPEKSHEFGIKLIKNFLNI